MTKDPSFAEHHVDQNAVAWFREWGLMCNGGGLMHNQSDQIGRFFNFLVTNLHTKLTKYFGTSLGHFKQCNFHVKNNLATFLAISGKMRQRFYSIIWSH